MAYVYVYTFFLNAELLRQGYARLMTVPPNIRYVELFRKLQTEAREAKRGLWGRSKEQAMVFQQIAALACGLTGTFFLAFSLLIREKPNPQGISIPKEGREYWKATEVKTKTVPFYIGLAFVCLAALFQAWAVIG